MSALRVDGLLLEVLDAFAEARLRPIVLKGPAIASWLYDGVGERLYVDCDLLVAPEAGPRAESVLRHHGFRPVQHGLLGAAHSWRRGDDCVDLHTSLAGLGVAPAVAWARLSHGTATIPIGGGAAEVEVLGEPARALHLALHVAHHDDATTKPRRDLERGLQLLPRETWAAAAALAAELRAGAAFTTGLRRVSGGRELLAELGVAEESAPLTTLLERGAPPTALGIAQLAATRSARHLPAALARAAFPTPGYMRRSWPGAERGPVALGAAYARRLTYLARHLPAGLSAWRAARRT